jgi:methylated-DNA-[protein]-cysteine S-methyltransferase
MVKNTQKMTKYVIFETDWGYFGLAGTESALGRTCLPEPESGAVRRRLLENCRSADFDRAFFKTLQEQIAGYFKGARIDFGPDIPVVLDDLSVFSRGILTVCRDVRFGRTVSYSELAKRSGRPAASRAVGSALARNPLPLIIPCHRVIRTDGKMGGFSASGGVSLKKKMLTLERQALST